MAILVTGGAGFIGTHAVVELIEAGFEVVVIDNFVNSSPEAVRRVEKITGKPVKCYPDDLCDKAAVERVFSENTIEAVIHFAGLKAVGESVEKPLEYYQNNLISTLVLCEVMRAHGCRNIVFSSSATVYGMNNTPPFTEDLPLSTTNPYGTTKLYIEGILKDLFVSDDQWSICLLRYFNPIGAHKSGLIGESPNGIPNNLLPYVAQVAIGKLSQLAIYGNDYDTPDGTGVRDYIHVVDLAKGHVKAVEYVLKHKGVEAVNLGTGNGSSVLDVVKAFEAASGRTVKYQIKPRRAGDIGTSYADGAKAKRLFGWEAALNLDDMCKDGWRFIQNNPDGIK